MSEYHRLKTMHRILPKEIRNIVGAYKPELSECGYCDKQTESYVEELGHRYCTDGCSDYICEKCKTHEEHDASSCTECSDWVCGNCQYQGDDVHRLLCQKCVDSGVDKQLPSYRRRAAIQDQLDMLEERANELRDQLYRV